LAVSIHQWLEFLESDESSKSELIDQQRFNCYEFTAKAEGEDEQSHDYVGKYRHQTHEKGESLILSLTVDFEREVIVSGFGEIDCRPHSSC